jgi:hypothetical protein
LYWGFLQQGWRRRFFVFFFVVLISATVSLVDFANLLTDEANQYRVCLINAVVLQHHSTDDIDGILQGGRSFHKTHNDV